MEGTQMEGIGAARASGAPGSSPFSHLTRNAILVRVRIRDLGLGFRVRIRVYGYGLGLGFRVRVRVRVRCENGLDPNTL